MLMPFALFVEDSISLCVSVLRGSISIFFGLLDVCPLSLCEMMMTFYLRGSDDLADNASPLEDGSREVGPHVVAPHYLPKVTPLVGE